MLIEDKIEFLAQHHWHTIEHKFDFFLFKLFQELKLNSTYSTISLVKIVFDDLEKINSLKVTQSHGQFSHQTIYPNLLNLEFKDFVFDALAIPRNIFPDYCSKYEKKSDFFCGIRYLSSILREDLPQETLKKVLQIEVYRFKNDHGDSLKISPQANIYYSKLFEQIELNQALNSKLISKNNTFVKKI